ncbi:MAG: radical SAM protein [Treponema sp.]|nr:radical SAM protein [Treponema sp.]
MEVLIINPPLVQLNAPYPSGAYLKAFFEEMGCKALWKDLSIELFFSIFSKNGLSKLFALTEEKALSMAKRAEEEGDEGTAFNLRRYISSQENWIQWIDFITAILRNDNKCSGREKEHQFLYSPFAPRGSRMENYLASLSAEPTVDNVRFLCSYALADLADYITAIFDKDFSLIRYAEALTVDDSSFEEIEQNIESSVMKEFYAPVLENLPEIGGDKFIVCISVPFAGTFIPALYTASFLKKKYGRKAFVCIGGGFVNTELRQGKEKRLGKYIDAISYDRGYGSYKILLNELEKDGDFAIKESGSIYKLRRFVKTFENDGKQKLPEADGRNDFWNESLVQIIEPLWKDEESELFEKNITTQIVPDYSDIDFSRYLRVCDDVNPMHRLWTDGTWLKAYLAHGCYWHKCAFCDTKLDYVCGYKPVNVEKLFDGLYKQAREKGIFGVHFVDEALPAVTLKKFALLNAQHGNPLYFWGNVRFEKCFTKDFAAFLSFCGFGGVSAGLEVATGEGLKNINKGTDLDSIVGACAAFKEAGILVHAYMIYGFWYDTPQTIIDSMETLRQFFASGLLDSAFWHKFVLTKNSGIFDLIKEKYCTPEKNGEKKGKKSIFAGNNVHFKGEEKYNKFGMPLENALNSWMHGEKLEMKISKWFDFPVPAPTIPKNFIENSINRYERRKNSSVQRVCENMAKKNDYKGEEIFWIGTKPVLYENAIKWFYFQEENSAGKKELGIENAKEFCEILWNLSPGQNSLVRKNALAKIVNSPKMQNSLEKLRNCGIVVC